MSWHGGWVLLVGQSLITSKIKHPVEQRAQHQQVGRSSLRSLQNLEKTLIFQACMPHDALCFAWIEAAIIPPFLRPALVIATDIAAAAASTESACAVPAAVGMILKPPESAGCQRSS